MEVVSVSTCISRFLSTCFENACLALVDSSAISSNETAVLEMVVAFAHANKFRTVAAGKKLLAVRLRYLSQKGQWLRYHGPSRLCH
jgi:hypothetical protein